jgi:hypothetical protein
MDTRVTTITASYTTQDVFEIPDDIFLLGKDANERAKKTDYGAWYIRFSTLYYIDKNGKEQELECKYQGKSNDFSGPDEVETLERCITPESEEDEDEEDEEEDVWEEVFNGDALPGIPYEHAGYPGRFYQTYGNGGGPGGSGGYWVKQGGEVWKVEGTTFTYGNNYEIEVRPKNEAKGITGAVRVFRSDDDGGLDSDEEECLRMGWTVIAKKATKSH